MLLLRFVCNPYFLLDCVLINAGKIKTIALTNFDTERLQKILENDIPVVSNQVNTT